MKRTRYEIYEGALTKSGNGDMYYAHKGSNDLETAKQIFKDYVENINVVKYLNELSNKGQGIKYLEFVLMDNGAEDLDLSELEHYTIEVR